MGERALPLTEEMAAQPPAGEGRLLSVGLFERARPLTEGRAAQPPAGEGRLLSVDLELFIEFVVCSVVSPQLSPRGIAFRARVGIRSER